jgi:hypothetical protein
MSRASHYRAQADFARRLAEPSSRIWSANYAPDSKELDEIADDSDSLCSEMLEARD